jgi:hypothetical protein
MKAVERMKEMLNPGLVYRNSDFAPVSTDIVRNLMVLVKEGALVRVHDGVFYAPKKTAFGPGYPNTNQLLQKFLKDDHFVVYSWNQFNGLGLGTTQLYDKTVVFNRKRHGEMVLCGQKYYFHRWREAPKQLTKEFLLVEMFNRFKNLAEDKSMVIENLRKKMHTFDRENLEYCLEHYAKESVKKEFQAFLEWDQNVPS